TRRKFVSCCSTCRSHRHARATRSAQRAEVGHTGVGSRQGVRRGGHIDQRNLRRRVGPQQVTQIDLRPSVDPTEARNTENQIAVGVSDRGTASPVLLAGRGVRAGFVGESPMLLDLEDGDLKTTVDFRRYYAGVLEAWLGLPSKPVLGEAFEPLRLIRK